LRRKAARLVTPNADQTAAADGEWLTMRDDASEKAELMQKQVRLCSCHLCGCIRAGAGRGCAFNKWKGKGILTGAFWIKP
jgi:hypothetical protein